MLIRTLDHITEIGFRLLIWTLYLYLSHWAPYVRHIEEEELWYYRYPSVPSLFPLTYLYIIMLGVPFIVFFAHFLCSSRDTILREIINQLYGISLAYCINAVFTSILKLVVGRPRPNFFYRCFPDGVGIEVQNCTGEWEGQMDGRKSFPSAHASFSFTGMVYVTCYIYKEVNFTEPCFGRGVLFFSSLTPIMIALMISLSRACDYHHHYSDIIGGALLGTSIAVLVFHHYRDMDQEKAKRFREHLKKFKKLGETEDE